MRITRCAGTTAGLLLLATIGAPAVSATQESLPVTSVGAATLAAAPTCGGTVTGYTVLRTDLTCDRRGLTLAPGATLDLGQHTLRVRTRDTPAVRVAARDGAASRSEIRNGTVRGGRGVAMAGTDDATDAGRAQRLRLVGVSLVGAPLSVTHAAVRVLHGEVIDSSIRMRGGALDVSDSSLSGVDIRSTSGPDDRRNSWRLTDSSVTGRWWTSGDTRVVDSTVIDTSAERSTPADYRNVTILGSRLTGPAFRIVGSGRTLRIGHSVIDGAGGFTSAGDLNISRSKIRLSGSLSSDPSSGRTTLEHATLVGGKGVKGGRIEATDSVFSSLARPVSGRTVSLEGNRFVGNRGDTVNAYGTVRAIDNVFLDNKATAVRARGGLLVRNDIRRQRGDGIRYSARSPDDGTTSIRLRANRVVDGKGWGFLVTQTAGLDLIVDLGGNVASGNSAGQCSVPLSCTGD